MESGCVEKRNYQGYSSIAVQLIHLAYLDINLGVRS